MGKYAALVASSALAMGTTAFSLDAGRMDKSCESRFYLDPHSKIVQLLVEGGAAQDVYDIAGRTIYAVEDFKGFEGVKQTFLMGPVGMKPLSILYSDAPPKGHSEGDALYVQVEMRGVEGLLQRHLQCYTVKKGHPPIVEPHISIELAAIAGLEYRLNPAPIVPIEKEKIIGSIQK
jgi:hypothetical protein